VKELGLKVTNFKGWLLRSEWRVLGEVNIETFSYTMLLSEPDEEHSITKGDRSARQKALRV
jgi:hypothetical protein